MIRTPKLKAKNINDRKPVSRKKTQTKAKTDQTSKARNKKTKVSHSKAKDVKAANKLKPRIKTRRTAKAVAKKQPVKDKLVPIKYPVTIKRFSRELQLIKQFINIDRKQKSMNALYSFHGAINNMLGKNPDRHAILSEMSTRLTNTINKAEKNELTDVIIKLENSFKERLTRNIMGARPKMKIEYLSGTISEVEKKSPVKSDFYEPDNLFQNINSIDEHTKDTFRLEGALGMFLGDLEPYKLAMSIEGDQGAGKTQLAFQFADAFAQIGYNVGLFELEIGANSNIIKRNRDKYIKPVNRENVQIAGEAPQGIDTVREYASKFGVIIIDSWTKLDVDSQEFDNLRNDFEDTIWVVLFQRTSANKIRGGTKPLYDAGINIDVVKSDDTFINNYAVATKNRYGQTGIKYNISSKKIVS